MVAWRGSVLTAVDPRGGVRWSLARPDPVASARWAPIDGFRIAYRSGGWLRIVNGDGTGDRAYGRAAPRIAPAWRPDDDHVLAYVDSRGRVDVVAVDERRRLWRSSPVDRVLQLAWSRDGRRLIALTARHILAFDRDGERRESRRVPGSLRARAAAWAPRGRRIAVVGDDPVSGRSAVALVDFQRDAARAPLFAGSGRLGEPAWSPDGRWLLVTWLHADQWLFLSATGGSRTTAVANMTSQYAPDGTRRGFPRSVEWCCTTDLLSARRGGRGRRPGP